MLGVVGESFVDMRHVTLFRGGNRYIKKLAGTEIGGEGSGEGIEVK